MSTPLPGDCCGEYTVRSQLGEGAVGKVFAAVDGNGERVALKFIGPLSNSWFKKEFDKEVESLLQFRNQYTVTLLNHFTWSNFGVIALEEMKMDLLDFIEDHDIVKEEEAKIIFKQICLGLSKLHYRDTAHLDIKPENIFMNDVHSVKLADFGSCFQWSKKEPKKFGISGTSFYCAPEVKNKSSYGAAEADMWSLGILLHVLCSGFWPYAARTDEELTAFIKAGKTELLYNRLPDNPDLIRLLRNLLQFFPQNRLLIEEVLESPWLEGIEIPDNEVKYELIEVSTVSRNCSEEKQELLSPPNFPRIPVPPLSISCRDVVINVPKTKRSSYRGTLSKKKKPLPIYSTSASNPDLSELPNTITTPRFETAESMVDEHPFLSPRGRRADEIKRRRSSKGLSPKGIVNRFRKLVGKDAQ